VDAIVKVRNRDLGEAENLPTVEIVDRTLRECMKGIFFVVVSIGGWN
jgi:hypothetical protein